MKKITILLVVIAYNSLSFSQSLQGIIKDKNNTPIPYVEVILKENKSKYIKSNITDEKGQYSFKNLKNSTYVLEIYSFGEKIFQEELLINKDIKKEISINKSLELDEVTVVAKKKLIDNKVDRLVFNVKNSMASSGMDLTEALSITPMVMVNDFGVSIVGKSGVSVMVNNKMLNISGSELVNYLKSLRSDNVEKIEVITAPPAKYEAEGNSGIINIILKKNPKLGWSGNVSTALS